ncbi:MAG: helix-turn-helix domain-containing protein [Clostridia bacterium]|nr:helix-turn-helix domain-containing protein [Clostridia bacterium]
MTANFRNLLHRAKNGDENSFAELLSIYKPLLLRESVLNGIFDEDLYQEQCIVFWRCVKTISFLI